jgi:hypothetical protein
MEYLRFLTRLFFDLDIYIVIILLNGIFDFVCELVVQLRVQVGLVDNSP